MFDYSKIPPELKALNHWLVANVTPDPQHPGKLKKIPKSAKTGRSEGWNRTENLSSFDVAAEFCEKNPGHVLGFAPLNSPFGALDFDNAFEGEGTGRFLKPEVASLIESLGLRNSYKEISPSGNGLRVFFLKKNNSNE